MLFPDVLSLTADVSACFARYALEVQAAVSEYQLCTRGSESALHCLQQAQEAVTNAYITAISCLLA